MGSHKDDTYRPDLKYVWAKFNTRLEADDVEDILHKLFDVVESSTFANLSKRTFRHWEWEGSQHAPSTIEKLRDKKLGKNNPQFGKPTSQKQKDAVRKAATGRKDSALTTKRKQLAQQENARLNKKGKKLYHNPETNQQKYFHSHEVPVGWVKGESSICRKNRVGKYGHKPKL
jgi:hypothetical protein